MFGDERVPYSFARIAGKSSDAGADSVIDRNHSNHRSSRNEHKGVDGSLRSSVE